MSPRRKEPDFFKYVKPDTEDNEVFFGPITLRELKRSVEVEEEIVKIRLEKKKNAKELANQLENEEDALDRTFEIDEPGDHSRPSKIPERVLNDVTQLHNSLDEAKLIDLSVQFSKTSMKPPKSVASVKQTKYLLDETVNFNESRTGVRLRTPLIDRVTRSRSARFSRDRQDSESKENLEPVVGTPRLIKLSDTFITDLKEDTILNATISDDLDTTEHVSAQISMKPPKSAASAKQTKCLLDETVTFNETRTGKLLRTPLIDKVTRSKTATFSGNRKDSESKENSEPIAGTPRLIKLSDTFITDLVGDGVLNTTISDSSGTIERVGTPDIFKQERNDIWKNSPKEIKSRIPVNKSPVGEATTCFFAKSPTTVVATASLSKKKTPSNKSMRLLPKSPGATLGLRSTCEKTSVKSQMALHAKSPALVASQSQSKTKTPAEDRRTLFSRSPAPSKLFSLQKQRGASSKKDRYLMPKSPVADYIRYGTEVKSMSKARHSSCSSASQDNLSKSDCKIAQSKIPVSTSFTVKRKLDLGEKLRQSLLSTDL